MLRIWLIFSTIAVFVRLELLCSSARRLPLNRANHRRRKRGGQGGGGGGRPP